MNTHCKLCGDVLEPTLRGRPRTYCRACSPTPPTRLKPQPAPPPPSDEPGRVEVAVLAEINRADAGDSVLAALAVTLAKRVDLGIDSGTGLAALSKAIRALVEEIGKAAKDDSIVAQLREARDRKRPRQRRGTRP